MATHEDAMLMMELMKWGESSGAMSTTMRLLRESRDGGSPPSLDDPDVMNVMILHETIGTFVKQGVLDADLVHDLLVAGWVWQTLREPALAQRAEMGEPRLWENFEALATG